MSYYSIQYLFQKLLDFYLYSISSRAKDFSLCHRIQTILGPLSPRISDRDMKMITQLHIVLMLKIYGAIPPLNHSYLWRDA
jgi:hypothetical protein